MPHLFYIILESFSENESRGGSALNELIYGAFKKYITCKMAFFDPQFPHVTVCFVFLELTPPGVTH